MSYACPPEGTVHIWVAVPEQCHEPALLDSYLEVLDVQERSRYEGFRLDHHRHTYLVAHGLLRFCLSYYGPYPPGEWAFSRNQYGRPEIAVADGSPPLRFNLSHTDGLVTCVVTRSASVGVDVERTEKAGDLTEVAELVFAPQELASLQQLTGKAWRDRFFDLWTLKEAYIKARGMGLSLPLQQFSFSFDPLGRIQFQSFAPAPVGDWCFGLMSPTQQHRLAVAVPCPTPLSIEVNQTVPGMVIQPLDLSIMTS